MFYVEGREQGRYGRIQALLRKFDSDHDPFASVLLDLSDDQTLSDFQHLAKRGFTLADAMRTEQLMKRLASRQRGGGKVDREQRDYAIAPLRELGIVEKVYVTPKRGWRPTTPKSEIIVMGHHSKSPNNAYRMTAAARALLDVPEEEFDERLAAFVVSDPRRRVRRLQKRSGAAIAGVSKEQQRHKALIRATIDALLETCCVGYELVFVDDDDDQRVREEWRPRLEALNLLPDKAGRYPDAMLVHASQGRVWIIDAVTSDGEIDENRREDLFVWLEDRGYTAAGFTTSYEGWKDVARRQSRYKNLAVRTTFWVAEDGGKLFLVESLAG